MWPINGIITGPSTPGQSEPEINANERKNGSLIIR